MVLGTDTPQQEVSTVESAFDALEEVDVDDAAALEGLRRTLSGPPGVAPETRRALGRLVGGPP